MYVLKLEPPDIMPKGRRSHRWPLWWIQLSFPSLNRLPTGKARQQLDNLLVTDREPVNVLVNRHMAVTSQVKRSW